MGVHVTSGNAEAREKGMHIHGIQSWVALPIADEETEPRSTSLSADLVPRSPHPDRQPGREESTFCSPS
jgi:redox-sensitive bicupin YhaK (pirin superfamily)